MLIASSLWLGVGVLGMTTFLFMLPAIRRSLAPRLPATSASLPGIVTAMVAGFLGFLYLLLPGFFLLFYTRKSVKAAFEAAEGKEDPSLRRPIPVMILCFWLLVGAAGTLLSSIFGVQFLFGTMLTGIAALALSLSLTAIQAFLARGLYRLQPGAWWSTLVFYLIMATSGEVTLRRVSLSALLGRLGYDAVRQEGMEEMVSWMQSHRYLTVAATNLVLLSLLIYCKRYFRREIREASLSASDSMQQRPSPPPA